MAGHVSSDLVVFDLSEKWFVANTQTSRTAQSEGHEAKLADGY